MTDSQRDVFLSYASEERDALARPLAEFLRTLGLTVWFDEFELRIGDNLRRRLDDGLKHSRFGLLLFSKAFFAKKWPNHELDAFIQREECGQHLILPVWVDVTYDEVRSYSPSLAGRVAAKWDEGLVAVARKITAVVKPELLEDMLRRHAEAAVPRLRNGHDISGVFDGTVGVFPFNDTPLKDEDANEVSRFIQLVNDWAEIWQQVEVGERVQAHQSLASALTEIEAGGWTVHGKKIDHPLDDDRSGREYPLYVLAVLRGTPEAVGFVDGKLIVARGEETELVSPKSGSHSA